MLKEYLWSKLAERRWPVWEIVRDGLEKYVTKSLLTLKLIPKGFQDYTDFAGLRVKLFRERKPTTDNQNISQLKANRQNLYSAKSKSNCA